MIIINQIFKNKIKKSKENQKFKIYKIKAMHN